MGSSKKHKEKDKEHKKKRKHKDKSRSKSPKDRKHKKDKKHSHEDREHGEPPSKRPREPDTFNYDEYGMNEFDRYEQSQTYAAAGTSRGDQDYKNEYSSKVVDTYDRERGGYEQPSYGREREREQQRYRHAEAYFDEEEGEEERYRQTERTRTTRSEVSIPEKRSTTRSEISIPEPVKKEIPSSSASSSADIPQPHKASGDMSLSIGETNRLRAKLGLKPLEGTGGASDAKKEPQGSGGLQEDVHKPAVNISHVKKQEELRQKLLAAKEKRRINKMLGKVKNLADDSDDDDALAWVKKSRKLQMDREMADKRAKILDMMDEEFGIGDLVEEEFKPKKAEYLSRDLRGLKVDHDQETFSEGKTIILTLKDKGILDEDVDDILENVNMIDNEKAKENIENKKKKIDYKPYDEPDIDEYGMMKPRDVLEKYDEEIHGKRKETFELGSGGKYDATHERRMEEIRQTLKQQGQALVLPAPILAREFYTEDEMSGFNKVKKKVRKIRKKPKALTADDLIPLSASELVAAQDHGSRNRIKEIPMEAEEEGELTEAIPGLDLIEIEPVEEPEELLGPDEDLSGVKIEDDAGIELELALNKARKLKHKLEPSLPEHMAANIQVREESANEEEDEDEETESADTLVKRNIKLNQTSEFCRSLGEIPTYGMAGNRLKAEENELLDFERELEEEKRKREEEEEQNPGWQQVLELDTRPVDITTNTEQSVLEEEPLINEGIGACLNLAQRKGLIENDTNKIIKGQKAQLPELDDQMYSIEDKRYDDLDEKFRKRDRFGGGIVSDFKEKVDYNPEVRIDYIDDLGRNMSQKEAFRYLSHRFHGKGSGKLKTEKRNKKYDQAQLLRSMTSNDTPLRTASMLTQKLKQEKTAFIVLSGANKSQQPSLSK